MGIIRLAAAVLALSAVFTAPLASADSFFNYHPSICETTKPKLMSKFKLNELGMTNVSGGPVWTICPIAGEVFDDRHISLVGMVLLNDSSSNKSVKCILRGGDAETGQLISISRTANLAPFSSDFVDWEVDNTEFVNPHVTCKVPPKVGLFNMLALFAL